MSKRNAPNKNAGGVSSPTSTNSTPKTGNRSENATPPPTLIKNKKEEKLFTLPEMALEETPLDKLVRSNPDIPNLELPNLDIPHLYDPPPFLEDLGYNPEKSEA